MSDRKESPDEMRRRWLRAAIQEAERFQAKARAAAVQEFPSKEFAAAKRASMDLTRALADLRRNPYQVTP